MTFQCSSISLTRIEISLFTDSRMAADEVLGASSVVRIDPR